MGILADSDLTPKQRLFIDAYLGEAKGNGIEAARIAGYSGSYSTLGVTAHDNLRNPKIVKAISQRTSHLKVKADKRIIKAREEFQENLEFARKLRKASEKWLVDPDDSEQFTIDPRASEIDVVYYDGVMQKRERLDVLLSRLEGYGIPNPTPFVKTVDLREYALKAMERCDMAIDKFAKMDGDYTKDKTNPADQTAIAKQVATELVAMGKSPEYVAEFVRKRYNVEVSELGIVG